MVRTAHPIVSPAFTAASTVGCAVRSKSTRWSWFYQVGKTGQDRTPRSNSQRQRLQNEILQQEAEIERVRDITFDPEVATGHFRPSLFETKGRLLYK